MWILADENCDRILVAALRAAGHDVTWVAEWGGGDSDDELFRRARAEQRIIVTNDRDFGLLAEGVHDRPPAIVLMRLDPLARMTRARRMVDAMTHLGDDIGDELVVIEPTQIRRREYRKL
jgi:predicted nuclease of predicted toxin-antitoxin system